MSTLCDLSSAKNLFTDAEREWQSHCTRAVEPFRSDVAGWYDNESAPTEQVIRDLGNAGMLGVHLEGYGLPGRSAVEYGIAAMQLEEVDSGLRSMLSVQGSLAMVAIHTYGTSEQKQQWLPALGAGEKVACFCLTEPEHGSDPGSMQTTASKTDRGWTLSGRKRWVTNGMTADVAIVWARTDAGINGFVVPLDSEGVQRHRIAGKHSLRASDTAELHFDEVELTDDHLLPSAKGLRSALSCLHVARFGIVFGALGAARDCLSTTLDYIAQRQQFGKPLAAFQLTQAKVADMTVAYTTALTYAVHLGRVYDAGDAKPAQVSIGKVNSTRVALEIARTSRTMLGANGTLAEHGLLRHANNLESVLTYEGTAEMHQLIIGSELTGATAFV